MGLSPRDLQSALLHGFLKVMLFLDLQSSHLYDKKLITKQIQLSERGKVYARLLAGEAQEAAHSPSEGDKAKPSTKV